MPRIHTRGKTGVEICVLDDILEQAHRANRRQPHGSRRRLESGVSGFPIPHPGRLPTARAMKTRSILAGIGLLIAVGHALAGEAEKSAPETPPDVKAIAGSYYCGDGLGYNVTLALKEDGCYLADWEGCLGRYGDASGCWKLLDKRIVLTPKKERDIMKGHLKTLDVLKHQGGWILVRSENRDFYDKRGVTRFSCFQKENKK